MDLHSRCARAPGRGAAAGRGVVRPSPCSRRLVVTQARAARYDRRKPPPPDLPSLLFDQRIVYLGMPVGGRCWLRGR